MINDPGYDNKNHEIITRSNHKKSSEIIKRQVYYQCPDAFDQPKKSKDHSIPLRTRSGYISKFYKTYSIEKATTIVQISIYWMIIVDETTKPIQANSLQFSVACLRYILT